MAQRGVIELLDTVRALRIEGVMGIAMREKNGMSDSLYSFWHWDKSLKEC